ncbi:MAG: ankyrin repeat domain-containing protein [Candidatus Chromulinivorax sp.]|nr:ankyrin repeat domain-containing protein [Candidatus Chromulinivorax sp.]
MKYTKLPIARLLVTLFALFSYMQTNCSDENPDINRKDKYGRSRLFSAVIRNNVRDVQFLINHGADVNIKDKTGDAPLVCAIRRFSQEDQEYDNLTIIDELIKAPHANINITGDNGSTALHHAFICKNEQIIDLLMRAGANIHALDNRNWGVLYYLMFFCQEDDDKEIIERNIKLLINLGANVNQQNQFGRRPLELAIRPKPPTVNTFMPTFAIPLLIDAGADTTSLIDDGLCYDNKNNIIKISMRDCIRDSTTLKIFDDAVKARSEKLAATKIQAVARNFIIRKK